MIEVIGIVLALGLFNRLFVPSLLPYGRPPVVDELFAFLGGSTCAVLSSIEASRAAHRIALQQERVLRSAQ